MMLMACMVTALAFLIFGIVLGADAAECRIYNQLNTTGVAFIKKTLFQGKIRMERVE